MAGSKVSRRDFIRFAGVATGAALLGACAPQVITQTQVVRETQLVNQTQVVSQVETQIVDRLVTPTAVPNQVTIQGRELPADAAPLEKQIHRQAGGEPRFLDVARDIYLSGGANLLNEPLVRNNENIELVPALAESWKASPDAKYWEFTIRKDAKFSDGEPITSDDAVYTFKHLADPKLTNSFIWFYFPIKGIQAFASGTGTADGIGVNKVDDRTFQIHGEAAVPYLVQMMAYQAVAIVPQHVAEPNPEHWADTVEGAVSSGPYIVTNWQHNQLMEFELNPMYNGPHKPAITKISNPILAAGATAFNLWLNKEIDLIPNLSLQDVAAVRADPRLNPLIHFFPNYQSTYLQVDTFNGPTANLDFRKALAHSIDRDILTGIVLNGTWTPGYSILPPGFPAYNPELKANQVFDLEQATAALTASGIDPTKTTLTITSQGGADDQFLQFVQQQWQTNLGITVNLETVTGADWGAKRAAHEMQIFRNSYEYDFVDPSNMLTSQFRSVPAPEGKSEPWGSPRYKWKNEEFDQLLDAAGAEPDVAKRIQQFQDAENILTSDVGAIFLAHQIIFQIWWPWVTGIHPDRSGNVVYRWLDISFSQMYIRNDVDELMANF